MKKVELFIRIVFVVLGMSMAGALAAGLNATTAQGAVMAVPRGQQVFNYPPTVSPVIGNTPSNVKPLGVGTIANGGDTLSLRLALGQFAEPVDVYVGLYAPAIDDRNVYLFTKNALQAFSAGLAAWRAAVTSGDEALLGDIPTRGLPDGKYTLYVMVTPAGKTSDYYGWVTDFNVKQKGEPGGPGGGGPVMNIENTISDQAQSATIAFDGLAFVTGSFCAQTFYPPGKVADFFGFQYLRDNDPSNLGHNTEFTTLSADPVLAILTDAQVKTFIALAEQEKVLSDEYGYARFPLAKAFRRLIDGDVPAGRAELSRDAVKAYSAYLFGIDGEMSYLRAQAYAAVLGSMNASQKAVLDAMKGKGAAEWQQPSTQPEALKKHGAYSVQLRTYAGEMLAWYMGSVDADVYFCPERQGTYFGSFFMKDIKAMHNPSYTIDSNMTADMGDAFLAALDSAQKAKVTGLVTEQKQDLQAIVSKRQEISSLLRNFLTQGPVDKSTVVGLAKQYGELDGEISYYYATRFSEVGKTLTASQTTTLTALRKKATAESDGSADYDTSCGNGYLYSAPLNAPPAVMNTDFMFGVCSASGTGCSADWDCCSSSCVGNVCGEFFSLASSAFQDGGVLPVMYTCDGAGGMLSPSPPLSWTGAPQDTVEFAITMTTVALDGTKWNWVLYHIPGTVTSLAENTAGVGTAGVSTDGPDLRYYPPCSTGPGAKTYTFTIYALSGTPTFSVPGNEVNGNILTSAISPLVIASRQVNVTYARSGL